MPEEIEPKGFIDRFVKSINFSNIFDNINDPKVSHVSSSAAVGHSPENSSHRVSDSDAATDQGTDENKRVSLSLSGMHCASCAGIIERSLKSSRCQRSECKLCR